MGLHVESKQGQHWQAPLHELQRCCLSVRMFQIWHVASGMIVDSRAFTCVLCSTFTRKQRFQFPLREDQSHDPSMHRCLMVAAMHRQE